MSRVRFLDPLSPHAPPASGRKVLLLALEEGPAARAARSEIAGKPGCREAEARGREDFLRSFADFTAALSRENAGLEWWASGVCGKNPLTLRLPERCFRLLLLTELRAGGEADEVWAVCGDRVLARHMGLEIEGLGPEPFSAKAALARWTPLGPVWGLARALGRLALTRLARLPAPEGGAEAVVFTLAGPGSFDASGAYRDAFFGELIGELARAGHRPLVVAHLAWSFRPTLQRLRAARGPRVLPLESFLALPALLEAFASALRRRFVDFPLRGSLALRGLDVGELVREELRENARGSRLFWDLWVRACAEGLASRVKPRVFYYPFENLARERMLLSAFRALSPSTRLVGYQHASLTRSHLAFLLGEGEAEVLPLPDRIVTMGEVTRDFLRDWGRFPERLLETGCALRQTFPGGALPARPEDDGRRPMRLLVVLATSVEESAGALRLLESAFGAEAQGPDLVLRPHPLYPLAAGLRLSGPVRFSFRDGAGVPPARAFADRDAVLYVSSTMGLEALQNGLPVVRLDLGGWLDPDPLAGFTDFKWTASNAASLRKALAEIRALPPARYEELRAKGRAFAARYFRRPSPEALEPFLSEAAAP